MSSRIISPHKANSFIFSGIFSVEINDISEPAKRPVISPNKTAIREKAEKIKQISRIVFRRIGGSLRK